MAQNAKAIAVPEVEQLCEVDLTNMSQEDWKTVGIDDWQMTRSGDVGPFLPRRRLLYTVSEDC